MKKGIKNYLGFKGKKGNIGDMIYVLGSLVALAFTILIAFTVYTQYNNEWQNMTEVPTEAKETVNKFNTYFAGMEKAFIFLIIGLTLALVVSAFLIPSTPALLFFNLIGLVVLTMVSALYSYVFKEFINGSTLLTASGLNYPLLTHIMNHFHYYAVGIVAIVTIVAYGKYKLVNDYGY